MKIFIILIGCSSFILSCTTMHVTKVPPNTTNQIEGVRYSLGKPFIKVIPKSDGTYSAELVYLPDENQTYAVKTSSFMTKHTMELNVDESGILKKIDFSKSTTSPASELVTTVGELTKAEIEKKNKEAKDLEEDVKENKSQLMKLKDQIAEKDLEIQVAKNEKESLEKLQETDITKEKLRIVGLLIKKLELEKQILEAKLSSLELEGKNLSFSANGPSSKMEAYGPVLFNIIETPATDKTSHMLKLIAVNEDGKSGQLKFQISSDRSTDVKQGMPIIISNRQVEAKFSQKKATITYTFDLPIGELNSNNSRIVSDDTTIYFKNIAVSMDSSRKILTIVVNRDSLKPDNYIVSVEYNYITSDGKTEDGSETVHLILKD